MGTSAGYQMPTGGEWTPLKNEATRFVQNAGRGNAGPESVLASYVGALEAAGFNPRRSGGDGGSGTGGGSRSAGTQTSKAAVSVSAGLGGFLSRVATAGLAEALSESGLSHLVGRTAAEIARGLVEALAGPASTIDDYAAKKACDDLRKELLADAKTAQDVEDALKSAMDARGLGGILMRYFSLYIFHRFIRDFYERWVAKVGSSQAASKVAEIKKYVNGRLKARMVNKDISAVNWKGSDGAKVVARVLDDTCRVFRTTGEKEPA